MPQAQAQQTPRGGARWTLIKLTLAVFSAVGLRSRILSCEEYHYCIIPASKRCQALHFRSATPQSKPAWACDSLATSQ